MGMPERRLVRRYRGVEGLNELDAESYAEAVEAVYELVRDGCQYRRAIRIALAQARRRASQKKAGAASSAGARGELAAAAPPAVPPGAAPGTAPYRR